MRLGAFCLDADHAIVASKDFKGRAKGLLASMHHEDFSQQNNAMDTLQ